MRVQARGFVPREHTSLLLEDTELREARLEPATSVKVQVADAQGKPIAGARVLATPDFSPSFRTRNLFDPWRAGERFGVTEPDGSVTFLKEAAETLKLEAGAPGQTTAESSVPADAQRALGTPVWIRPTLSAACTVTVEVADRERKPVAGALVSLDPLNLASTDAAGRAALPAPCGKEAAIRASLADGRRAAATLGAKRVQGEPFRLTVPPQPVRLSGRALEEGSRQPIAGAFVWSTADPGRAVQTGRDGGYALTVLPGEKTMLLAASVQHVEGFAEHDAPAEGGTHPGPSFALSPTALAAGTVVDETGKPVAGAQIQAVAGTFRMSTAGRGQQTRSGDRGAFRLRVSSGQAYDLKVTSTGFAPASVPLPEMAPRAARQDLRIVLQRGRKATGTVLDAQERPVAGARLVLRPGRSPERMPSFPFGGPEDAFEATSGADGRFAFDHLTPGRFDLRAQAAGFGPVVVPGLEVRADAESTSLGTVILQPGVELAGVVVDDKDRPVAGARVETHPDGMRFAPGSDDGDRMEATTAADGSFVFSGLGTGSRRAVAVTGEGYASRNLSGVELPLAQPLKIVLAPGSRIAGRAVDERGQPVQRALVQVTKTGTGASLGGRSFSLPVGTAVTDELGRFEVKNLEAGNLTLRAEADGKRPTEMANLELTAGKDLDNLEVVLRAGAVVTGQVLGPDGKPVAGARIEAEGEPGFRMPTMSDGDGKYRFGGLEPGPRVLSAEHSDYQRVARNLDVQPGENRLDFHLGGGHTVAGRVIDFAGQPVEGATLALQSPDWRSQSQARSGADGSFQIANVGAGLYTLTADRQGYASARVPEVRVAGPVSGLEVRLDRGGTIRGRLLGIDFSALGQVTIMARQTGGAFTRGQADFRAEYRVDGVAAGEWQVTAFLAQDGRRAEGKVLVEAGAEAVLDLDFDDKGGLTLSGRVLYRGEPRDGLRVYAQGTDSRSGGSGQTNQDGVFRISGLAPGTYNVSLMSFGSGVSHQQAVELTADREIVIELPESRLSGQVVDAADSSAVEGATVTLEPLQPAPDTGSSFVGRRTTKSDTAGAFTLSDVGEGSYRVVARKEGYGPAESTVQVAPGAAVEGIRLSLSSTQGLTLQVSSPAGSPREVQLALLEGSSGRVVLAGSYPVAEGGQVRLSDAPPGRWSLLVSSFGAATASLEVSVPGPPTAVALPPAVQLLVTIPDLADSSLRGTLTVQGTNGRPYQAMGWGGTVQSQWPAYEGRSQLELPPGNWKLTVAAPDGRTWQGTATTVPGTPGEVTLR